MACKQYGNMPKSSMYWCAAYIRWSVLESRSFLPKDWGWILNENAFYHLMQDSLLHKPVYAPEDSHDIDFENVMELLHLVSKDLGGQILRHKDVGFSLRCLLGQFPPAQQKQITNIYQQLIGAYNAL